MRCARCHSHMNLTRREDHRDSYLEWYNCRTCGRTEFVSYPARMTTEPNYSAVAQDKKQIMPVRA
jgi:hypothetical protein